MSVLVLINAKAGTVLDRGEDAVRADLQEALAGEDSVRFVSDDVPALKAALAEADEDTVVTVGGDGTIGALASVLADREGALPVFIPLPFGTANLIPRDLGFPMDAKEALRAALAAPSRRIDYATCDSEPLLHSAVFGTFAEVAEVREEMREADGPLATLTSAAEAASRLLDASPSEYRVTVDGGVPETVATNAIFVTNNEIDGGEGGIPARGVLDSGHLTLYLSASQKAGGFMRRMADLAVGGLGASQDVIRHRCQSLTVEALGQDANYTVDGEVRHASGPVRLAIVPGALSVPDLRSNVLRPSSA